MKKFLAFAFALVAVSPFLCGQTERQRPPAARPPEMARPLFLSGQVLMEDDTPLPHNIRVVLFCNGAIVQETHCDVGGRFSMQLGRGDSRDVISADVSSMAANLGPNNPTQRSAFAPPVSGSSSLDRGQVNMSGCTLNAWAAGYSSTEIQLGMRRLLDSPDVGAMTLSRARTSQATAIDASTLAAPPEAREAFNKAVKALSAKKQNYKKASRELELAVNLYPGFAQAWRLLGKTKLALNDPVSAQTAFEKAIAAEPDLIASYLDLGEFFLNRQQWEETVQIIGPALSHSPEAQRAHYYLSLAHFNLGNSDLAEASAQQALQLGDPDAYAGLYFILGAVLSQKGDAVGAARNLRRFLQLNPEGPDAERVTAQLELWEKEGLLAPQAKSN